MRRCQCFSYSSVFLYFRISVFLSNAIFRRHINSSISNSLHFYISMLQCLCLINYMSAWALVATPKEPRSESCVWGTKCKTRCASLRNIEILN